MPEVRCEQHGVFDYKSSACPGCATEREMEQEAALSEAEDQFWKLVGKINFERRERIKKQEEFDRAVRDAEAAHQRHLSNAPEKPQGLDAWLKRRAYEEAERAFMAESVRLERIVQDQRLAAERFSQETKNHGGEVSAEVLAAAMLLEFDPKVAALAKAAFIRQAELKEKQREEQERMGVALAALDQTYGGDHQLGEAGEKWKEYVLLGAGDLCGKRYARLYASWRENKVVCVPWIDAFAEHIGKEVTVEWTKPPKVPTFRVGDRDGRIFE